MPVKFIENHEQGVLAFWEITETTAELTALYQPVGEELRCFLSFKNESRKREWLAARLLLQEMTGGRITISYHPDGRPFLVNFPGQISISHASDCVAMLFHLHRHPGIDIESIRRPADRAARRFLSASELADCTIAGNLSNPELILRWCAKEAVFKMIPARDVDFARQISCEAPPLQTVDGAMSAFFTSMEYSLKIPLNFRCVGEIMMVWGTLEAT